MWRFSLSSRFFLLDIRPSLGLCPLKIRGASQAKWTKASSVLIWRTMAESIHDSRPSIWTSPHNRLRSQIPFSFSPSSVPGPTGCGGAKRKKEQASTFFFVRVCQIFYSTWNLKWWSGDSPSQVERKSNFFSNFLLHTYLKKETRF